MSLVEFSLRIARGLAVAAAAVILLSAPGRAAAQRGGGGGTGTYPPTVATTGSPEAPVTVTVNTNYSINVSVSSNDPTCYAASCEIYSSTSGSSGPWAYHGSYGFSGQSYNANHTFTVVNQDSPVSVYWKGLGWDTCSQTGWQVDGPFDS